MSDQVPSQTIGKVDAGNLINLPAGGGNVISINADPAALQTLIAGAGISIIDGGGGVHTITNTAPGAAALVSINGDATPAQVIAVGAGLSIVNGGGGLHTLTNTAPATPALVSINADTTPAQVFNASTGIAIFDFAGGTHVIQSTVQVVAGVDIAVSTVGAQFFVDLHVSMTAGVGAAGIAVVNGVNTTLATVVAPSNGKYQVNFAGGVAGVTGNFMDCSLFRNGVFVQGFSGMPETTGQTVDVIGGIGIFNVIGGDSFTVVVNHHGGAGNTTSRDAVVQLISLGTT